MTTTTTAPMPINTLSNLNGEKLDQVRWILRMSSVAD